MTTSALNTTRRKGSMNILTTEDGQIPQYLINGIPLGDGADYIVERFTTTGIITSPVDLVLSTGTHTLTMPLTSASDLRIKSISGTITLDPGTNTFEGFNFVSSSASRVLFLDGTVWRDI